MKNNFSCDACLQYFYTSKPVILQVDASKRGLEAVLIQEDSEGGDKPVVYASKSLIPAESRYANIKQEMQAVVFGCMRFHHYFYSWKFTCQSDHKPVEDIHLEHLSDEPPRLQRLLLKIQPYDFVIKYVPGTKIPKADVFSSHLTREG